MNVSELYHLTLWIDREIKNEQILERYQKLQAVLQSNSSPNRTQQPFESEKNDLTGAISRVPLESLSTEQVEFLRNIGIADHVGEEAIKKLEDILFRNVIDVATAAQKLNEIVAQIKAGIQRSDQLQEALRDVVIPKELELEGRVLVRVTFAKEARIGNIVDLQKWSDIWLEIGRGVALINDATPEDVEVVGAGRGSVVIELAVVYGLAKTISVVILEALKVAEKVLDIRKKAQELRSMKLSNSKIAKELEEEAEKEKEKGIELITDKIAKTKRKKDTDEGDKIVALAKSVKSLVCFVEKGGEVDCILPEEKAGDNSEEKPEPNELKELRANFKEIRQLEMHLEQLEDRKAPEQEAGSK